MRATLLLLVELVACAARPASTSRPSPTQVRRVFLDNSTRPRLARSGFKYPRYDARLHHGDEVQLETVHQSWLSITSDPSITLQGRQVVLRAFSGKYCATTFGDLEGKFLCNFTSLPLTAWLKFEQGRRLGPKTSGASSLKILHMGSSCVDWPSGWRCNSSSSSGHDGREHHFRVLSAGRGRIAMRGARGHFCADDGPRGIVCDRLSPDNTTIFEVVTDTPLRYGIVHSQDRHVATTFVVHRKSLDSGDMALFCKDWGYYLAADGPRGEVSCSSREPWVFRSARVSWWDMASATFQSPATRQYLEAPDFSLDVKVRTDNKAASGWALFKVVVLGGYEVLRPLIRGVNLGNWFLLEKWMAPRLFHNSSGEPFEDRCSAIDELGLMSALGPGEGRRRMEEHWATWITEVDIAWLAIHGINAVRVPFGYWMVYPTPPFVAGQLKYLRQLFQWCERHSVAILLDFHGLKGSQTTNPTSGNCGACGRHECGATHVRFLEEEKMNLLVIDKLTSEFSSSPAYLGFSVANEVASKADSKETMAFYQKAYDMIRRKNEDALIVFFATFNPSSYPFPNFRNVAQDVHIYFGMGFGGPPTADQQHNLHKAEQAVGGVHWPVLVGEWSLGGSGNPKLPPGPDQMERFLLRFAQMQLQAYENHCLGWFYWSYKTMYPNSTWNFRDMCIAGWLPECTKRGLDYSTPEWWNASSCAYDYLDGACAPRARGPWVALWPAFLMTMLSAATLAALAAVAVLRPPWAEEYVASAKAAASAASEAGISRGMQITKAWWFPQFRGGWQRMHDHPMDGRSSMELKLVARPKSPGAKSTTPRGPGRPAPWATSRRPSSGLTSV